MSRIFQWIDRPRQQREDMAQIIDDLKVSVDVYRVPDSAPIGVGFTEDVPDLQFHTTLTVAITKQAGGQHSRVSSDGVDGVRYDLVATSLDHDIRKDDVWEIQGRRYEIVSVDDEDEIRTEVTLRRFRNERIR